MLICTRHKENNLPDNVLNVCMNGSRLENSQMEKLLGVRVDSKLTWHNQVDYVFNNVSSRIAMLRRIKQFIDIPTRILYFNGYIMPVLDYCSLVWSTCSRENIHRIERLLKSAARVILDASYNERSSDLFNTLGWKTFEERLKQKRAQMVYKSLHGFTPTYMNEMFLYTNSIHDHGLRSSSTFSLHMQRGTTELHKKRFSYIGAKQWNELPPSIRQAPTLRNFKFLLQSFI